MTQPEQSNSAGFGQGTCPRCELSQRSKSDSPQVGLSADREAAIVAAAEALVAELDEVSIMRSSAWSGVDLEPLYRAVTGEDAPRVELPPIEEWMKEGES